MLFWQVSDRQHIESLLKKILYVKNVLENTPEFSGILQDFLMIKNMKNRARRGWSLHGCFCRPRFARETNYTRVELTHFAHLHWKLLFQYTYVTWLSFLVSLRVAFCLFQRGVPFLDIFLRYLWLLVTSWKINIV